MSLALAAFTKLAQEMMCWEVSTLAGPKNKADGQRQCSRWGAQQGYCVVGGQKVAVKRPRVRDVRQREVALGSYELLQQASLMEDAVWHKIMSGLTTRRYSDVVRELKEAYGIEKSTVSEHFVEASRRRLEKLQGRRLEQYALCAMMIDGTCYDGQDVIAAIGFTVQGHKVVLGLQQGATENNTIVRHLLRDLAERGVDFEIPRLYVLDGGKALHSMVGKMAGKCGVIQRCQEHRIRNVIGHLTEEFQTGIRCKMRNAYATHEHGAARRALDSLLRELMDINPSAARSLEEGMEETLAMHRLRLPENQGPVAGFNQEPGILPGAAVSKNIFLRNNSNLRAHDANRRREMRALWCIVVIEIGAVHPSEKPGHRAGQHPGSSLQRHVRWMPPQSAGQKIAGSHKGPLLTSNTRYHASKRVRHARESERSE